MPIADHGGRWRDYGGRHLDHGAPPAKAAFICFAGLKSSFRDAANLHALAGRWIAPLACWAVLHLELAKSDEIDFVAPLCGPHNPRDRGNRLLSLRLLQADCPSQRIQ